MRKFWILVLLVIIVLGGGVFMSKNHDHVVKVARAPEGYSPILMGKEQAIFAFSDDLLTKVAREQHVGLSLISVARENLLLGLNKKLFDAIVVVTTGREPLNHSIIYSDTYFDLGPVLILPKNSPFNSIKEMLGKTVGITKESPLLTSAFQYYGQVTLVTFDNVWVGFEQLSRNQIDGFVLDSLPAYLYVESLFHDQFKVLNPPLMDLGLKIATLNTPEGAKWINEFNSTLKQLEHNEVYQNLLSKWGFKDYPVDFNQ